MKDDLRAHEALLLVQELTRHGLRPSLQRLADPQFHACRPELLRLHLLADWYVTSDIEINCPSVHLHDTPGVWYDTRPMVDPREHSPEFVDMAQISLDHAQSTGLFAQHPVHTYLVRFVRRA